MSQDTWGRPKGGIKGDQARKARLAEELRQNLLRRKARARKLGADGSAKAGAATDAPDRTADC